MDQEIDMLALRGQLEWTQEQMAQFLGIDRSSVSRLESGAVRIRGPVRRLLQSLKDQVAEGAIAVPAPAGAGPNDPALSPAADEASLASAAGAPHSVAPSGG